MRWHFWYAHIGAQPVKLTLGWQAQKKRFFCQLSSIQANDHPEELLYSSQQDEQSNNSMSYYVTRLAKFGLVLPVLLINRVLDDKRTGATEGEVYHNH